MKPDTALLVDVGSQGRSTRSKVALRSILEPHFSMEIVMKAGGNRESKTSLNSLDAIIKSFDPVVIFLLFPTAVTLEQTQLLESVRKILPNVPIIAIIEACEPDFTFELQKVGAADFVMLPLKACEVLARTWRLLKPCLEEPQPAQTLKAEVGLERLIGESPDFLTQVKKIPLIAKCDVNVVIAGETGTGKEVYARAIHYFSSRAGRPFIPVNCGAIPVDLVENELFGHERGAFTNAFTLQSGLIEEANGGTLFLDEIDCLPVLSQVKLLRFLQEKEYRPLGSARMRRADVRIIAASNLNLEEAVRNGKLRQDLFYRLNTISLTLPPLRERREDIPQLAQHFLEKYSREFEKETPSFSADALHLLMVYAWPGNVRELEHVIERAIVLCEGDIIRDTDLVLSVSQPNGRVDSLQEAKAKEIARFEKNYIQGLLTACRGNITRAARVAQKNRRAFWQLIQKHQIDVARFKSSLS